MQVGLRPRLKARPSLVDLLRRSRHHEQDHLESHFESVPSVDGPAAASSHSPPPEAAPLSAATANQELLPASLTLEAQHIASTYQLPGSPSKLQPPSTPPLSLNTVLQPEPRPIILSHPHSHESRIDGPAAEPTAPPKMAPVSFVHFSNLPHRRQAPRCASRRAACYPAGSRERHRANFTFPRCRNKQRKMGSIQVSYPRDNTVLPSPANSLSHRQDLLRLWVSLLELLLNLLIAAPEANDATKDPSSSPRT